MATNPKSAVILQICDKNDEEYILCNIGPIIQILQNFYNTDGSDNQKLNAITQICDVSGFVGLDKCIHSKIITQIKHVCNKQVSPDLLLALIYASIYDLGESSYVGMIYNVITNIIIQLNFQE